VAQRVIAANKRAVLAAMHEDYLTESE
jgi:hypothetical protein